MLRRSFPEAYKHIPPTDDEALEIARKYNREFHEKIKAWRSEHADYSWQKSAIVLLVAKASKIDATLTLSGERRQARFDRIDERLAALEDSAVKGLNYRGVFNRAETYDRGDIVTHGGSAFYCLKNETTSPPSHEGSEKIEPDWQMFVRRGRDARSESR